MNARLIHVGVLFICDQTYTDVGVARGNEIFQVCVCNYDESSIEWNPLSFFTDAYSYVSDNCWHMLFNVTESKGYTKRITSFNIENIFPQFWVAWTVDVLKMPLSKRGEKSFKNQNLLWNVQK